MTSRERLVPAALALAVMSAVLGAQSPASRNMLAGAIDVHAHAGPDGGERSIDALDLARLARDRGMRGLVLKDHGGSTAALAYAARKAVPGIEVFGAIVLNRSIGGINVAAVEEMASVEGGWGRVVWMPTRDSEHGARNAKAPRPFVSIARNGQLLPEVRDVLKVMAARKLTLATGHSSPAEDLLLIREAKAAGIDRIIVTHPMIPGVGMSLDQMKEAGALGAYLELAHGHLLGANATLTFESYAAAIRAVGPDHVILSTDLGQPGNPLHPDGLEALTQGLAKQGFSQEALDLMTKTNPAKVLGLE
jgi:hypothetical protein